jgi:hypothetical protein
MVDDLFDLAGEVWEIDREKSAGGWLIHREERVSNRHVRQKLGLMGANVYNMKDLGKRISDAMASLGWTKAHSTLVCERGAKPEGGYRRPTADRFELICEAGAGQPAAGIMENDAQAGCKRGPRQGTKGTGYSKPTSANKVAPTTATPSEVTTVAKDIAAAERFIASRRAT